MSVFFTVKGILGRSIFVSVDSEELRNAALNVLDSIISHHLKRLNHTSQIEGEY